MRLLSQGASCLALPILSNQTRKTRSFYQTGKPDRTLDHPDINRINASYSGNNVVIMRPR